MALFDKNFSYQKFASLFGKISQLKTKFLLRQNSVVKSTLDLDPEKWCEVVKLACNLC